MITDYTIKKEGDFNKELSSLVDKALTSAENNDHKLNDLILNMEGMSGKHYRKFINNLIGMIDNPRYLEIGSLKGSTACSAMFQNKTKVQCIDNWHWNWKLEFEKNTSKVVNDDVDFNFLQSDFRSVDYSTIGKFNVYMYDGPHSARDQYDGIVNVQSALDDYFILIVDDWNWDDVKNGTMNAIKFLDLKIESQIEVITHNYSGENGNENSLWHNGYYIATLKK
jgi:hypothetical protein